MKKDEDKMGGVPKGQATTARGKCDAREVQAGEAHPQGVPALPKFNSCDGFDAPAPGPQSGNYTPGPPKRDDHQGSGGRS